MRHFNNDITLIMTITFDKVNLGIKLDVFSISASAIIVTMKLSLVNKSI